MVNVTFVPDDERPNLTLKLTFEQQDLLLTGQYKTGYLET